MSNPHVNQLQYKFATIVEWILEMWINWIKLQEGSGSAAHKLKSCSAT
jgi:hypothetical protein